MVRDIIPREVSIGAKPQAESKYDTERTIISQFPVSYRSWA